MKNWDTKKTFLIAGAIFIVVSLVVAVCEYGGITNYIETWP